MERYLGEISWRDILERYLGESMLAETYTHTHTHTNSLATASGYVQLAEPGCLCTGARLGTHRRTGLSSQQVVWVPEVPPGPLLLHEKRPSICTPANARSPITSGWTGGTGGRQMENQMEPDGTRGPRVELSQGHNHYTTHTTSRR